MPQCWGNSSILCRIDWVEEKKGSGSQGNTSEMQMTRAVLLPRSFSAKMTGMWETFGVFLMQFL